MTAAAERSGPAASAKRVVGAWYDHPRALAILAVLFVAAWTCFHTIAYAPVALHPDVVEMYAWSRHPSAGYYKHPPLGPWMVAAWFAVFPTADWAFHLFAMVNAAIGLAATGLIARRYLGGDKRLVAVVLLLLTPFYQFQGQRFGASQILLSTWPIATLCFLRAFETRTVLWSAAAGAAAALAMLGKYYSVYLIAAFVIAALAHAKRWAYLRSVSPWVSALVGAIVLAPHFHWLYAAGPQTFDFAVSVHGNDPISVVVRKALEYIPGSLAFVAVPLAVCALLVRLNRRVIAAMLWPADPDRRMLVVLLAVTWLMPVLTLPLFGISITSLWSMPAWFLLPVVLLAPPEVEIARPAAVRVALLVLAVTLACLIAAPALAWYRHVGESKEARAYYPALSLELTQAWRRATGQPLTIVAGAMELTPAVTFYSPDHPDSIPGLDLAFAPWITPERVAREGVAAVCRAEDRACYDGVMGRIGDSVTGVVHYQTVSRFLGKTGAPARFVFMLAPPKQ
jgi:4-amino-4-deoxy-L-arabinose transferase-like glycosyltransferase